MNDDTQYGGTRKFEPGDKVEVNGKPVVITSVNREKGTVNVAPVDDTPKPIARSQWDQIVQGCREVLRKAKGTDELPGDTLQQKYSAFALDKWGNLSVGRAGFKGRRRNPHWNKTKLDINSAAQELFQKGATVLIVTKAIKGEEPTDADFFSLADRTGHHAMFHVAQKRRAKRRQRNGMQKLSRRINSGNALGRSLSHHA